MSGWSRKFSKICAVGLIISTLGTISIGKASWYHYVFLVVEIGLLILDKYLDGYI